MANLTARKNHVHFSNFTTRNSQEISEARNRTLQILSPYLEMYTTEVNGSNALQHANDQTLNIQH